MTIRATAWCHSLALCPSIEDTRDFVPRPPQLAGEYRMQLDEDLGAVTALVASAMNTSRARNCFSGRLLSDRWAMT